MKTSQTSAGTTYKSNHRHTGERGRGGKGRPPSLPQAPLTNPITGTQAREGGAAKEDLPAFIKNYINFNHRHT